MECSTQMWTDGRQVRVVKNEGYVMARMISKKEKAKRRSGVNKTFKCISYMQLQQKAVDG